MNVIPPMTDPSGRSWRQPSLSAITVNDTHALMDQAAFDRLKEYSYSLPSGVYEGKLWKRHENGRWLLCWFYKAPETPEDEMDIGHREIIVI